MESRTVYISGNPALDLILDMIADRLDQIEGLRGIANIYSELQMNGNQITGLADAEDDQDALPLGQAKGLIASTYWKHFLHMGV